MKKRICIAGYIICLLLAGCGGGSSSNTDSQKTSKLESISVSPTNSQLPKGLSQQLSAVGHYSDGSAADMTTGVVWSSSASSIASINSTGLVNGVSMGKVTISASLGAVTGTTGLSVAPPILQSISITPKNPVVAPGRTKQLVAIGTFSDQTTQDITAGVKWISEATFVATVNSTGLVNGIAMGTTDIMAKSGAISTVAALNVATGIWSLAGKPALKRIEHTATLLPNGKVLVAGGEADPVNLLSSAELYDPLADTWTTAGSMRVTRSGHTATLLPNGKVLVAGGSIDASAELYDPAHDSWSAAANLSKARVFATATLLPNGKVLVVGGGTSDGIFVASAEVYDPVVNTWAATGPLANQSYRYYHTATLLKSGKVLIVGGVDGSDAVASAQLYDPTNNSWSSAGALAHARYLHTTTLLPDGRVVVAGGFGSANSPTSAEVYDPSSNTWFAAHDLTAPRWRHTATLLPNGKILVAGGTSNTDRLSATTAEIYDPVADTWSSTGNLNYRRDGSTAALLPNGQVLITGGNNDLVVAAEVYF